MLFIYTFYTAYSTKIEKDQQTSILRNQQYNNLLLNNINIIKELKGYIAENPQVEIDKVKYETLYSAIYDAESNNFLIREQKAIAERTSQFSDQYHTISKGVGIITGSALLQIMFIFIMGWMINKMILLPINNISAITEQISRGNLNLRIPTRENAKLIDELDRLSGTFNDMLNNLQNMMNRIKEGENFLQSVINSIPDGIRVIDEDYNIIVANKSYYELSGSNPKANVKCFNSSFGYDTPCGNSNSKCPIIEILQKKQKTVNTIQQFSHLPNRYLAVNAAPLIYDERHHYIIESIRDLSKDVDFSHQQKVSSLGFLSSSIAHEIKNQLGALRIITEHLMMKFFDNKPDDAEDKKLIKMIYSEIVNATQVPERLLKLTRNREVEYTTFDCSSSIVETVELLDYEAKINGVEIEMQKPTKKILLSGNETDFKIASINIILNAIKAMPNKGVLKIKITSSPKNGIRISFADNGTGISKENLRKIFNPFFSQGNQNKISKGTGLGLSIAKSIIEKQGGSIEVESTVGKGSVFTFAFPSQKSLQNKKQENIRGVKKVKKDKTNE